jgi:hypothetical protein
MHGVVDDPCVEQEGASGSGGCWNLHSIPTFVPRSVQTSLEASLKGRMRVQVERNYNLTTLHLHTSILESFLLSGSVGKTCPAGVPSLRRLSIALGSRPQRGQR